MELNLARLLVGLSIQISRSNGRVHRANIKTVDAAKSSVIVEWHEREKCLSKEVDLNDLCALNPELEDHIHSAATKAVFLQPPEKPYEGRLRSSRIPAPSSTMTPAASRVEEKVARKTHRPTGLYQTPASASALSLATESARRSPERFSADACPPVLTASAIVNQTAKRNEGKQAAAHLSDAATENEDPQSPPHVHAARGRRKTVAPQDSIKVNKRISCVMKPPEPQVKRGKFAEVARPNQKFYQMIQDFRETLEVTPLLVTDVVGTHKICVCVRKRPLNRQEESRKEIDVVSIPGNGALLVHEPKQKVDLTKYLENQQFQFDYCFDESATNDLVYRFTAKPLVQAAFDGSMATCFAYGQTGSGKTHTMGGDFCGKQQNSATGIYFLAAQDVFTLLNDRKYSSLNLCPYVSFFEIYNGKVFDLLNKKARLRVLEDERQQVQVVGLEEVFVTKTEDVIKMIAMGSACRTSGQTSANANSSRSHAILQIALRHSDRAATLYSKFSLVDLAGNERGTDVNSNDRNTLVETAEINSSLLALKECIRSLGKNSEHIPFRMSTLTKVLRDSFIGKQSRTCMIAMVSPSMKSCDYTLNTLRYADRVKELNRPKAGTVAKEQDPISSSSDEESSVVPSVDEVMFQVTQLKEGVYDELQSAKEFAKEMEKASYNIAAGLPDLEDYAKKLLDTVLALKTAVAARRSYR